MFTLHQVPFKNLKAHPARTVIMTLLIMAQVLSVFLGLVMAFQMKSELQIARERLGADIIIYPTQAMSKIKKDSILMQGTPVSLYKPLEMLSRLDECEGIKALTRQVYLLENTDPEFPFWITGIEPETDFVITPWLENDLQKLSENTVLTGSFLSSENKMISLFGKQWPVSGQLMEIGSDLDRMVFVSMDMLPDIIASAKNAGVKMTAFDPETSWSAVLIRAENGQSIESVSNWINIYVRKVTAIRNEETLSATASDIQNQVKLILFVVMVIWILLLIAQIVVSSMLMNERRKEIFVWQVIGASVTKINDMMQIESALITVCGGAFGILIGFLVLFFFDKNPFVVLNVEIIFLSALIPLLITFFINYISTKITILQTIKRTAGQMLMSN